MHICITYIRPYSLFSRLEIRQIRSLEVPSPTNHHSVHVSIQSISHTFLYNHPGSARDGGVAAPAVEHAEASGIMTPSVDYPEIIWFSLWQSYIAAYDLNKL